ncbi:allantoate amidohydrolase [Haloechinothrix sp. YIM 98757]|uniref:Allantoate amidohydrolase n=1 Tax=Haloechinothrix aidingensis TaxID=2752311 RepID=A0A838ACU0_9PSEU|nr:allantoate amidohydrolase [Haloechinothrix aidingensis]
MPPGSAERRTESAQWTESVIQRTLGEIEGIGGDRLRGGYSRHVFTSSELELREWFRAEAAARDLDVEQDRNGNLWAWWTGPAMAGQGAVVTGSHLDSVPGGGAFDGPLGVVSALCAVDRLRAGGFRPARPVAVVVFAEEEGGRFGLPCLGSRLMTGAVDPARALRLRDADGYTFAEAAEHRGVPPRFIGPDPERLARIGTFVELHVEQGRRLVDLDEPVAVASTIDPHGRWRLSFTGVGDHAGTAVLDDRRDPMVPAARAVLAARAAARAARADDARATVGRVTAYPGGTNVVPSRVDVWLDARAAAEPAARAVATEVEAAARSAAEEEGCEVEVREESWSETTRFDPALRAGMRSVLGDVPVLATGAGHDAGVLAAHVPAGMLYVRNPTGISHAPDEHAEPADCADGVVALARVIAEQAACGEGGG